MNRVNQFLSELKSGTVTPEDVVNAEFLTKEERKYLLTEYNSFLEKRLQTSQIKKYSQDPIDKQTTIYTWGTDIADKTFSPIQPHTFAVFAGQTGGGKTAFSFDMAIKNAKNGHKVLYLSLEMTAQQIITRVARSYAGITKEMWRDKTLIADVQRTAYKRKVVELSNIENFEIYGFGKGKTPTLDAILDVIEANNPKLAFIDNMDLISLSNDKRLEHEQTVSRKIMNFTNEIQIPIILIHHIKKTKDKTMIESIRGSAKLTDDADAVYICSRKMNTEDNLTEEEKAQFLLIERKDREFGEGGIHKFYFNKGTFIDNFKGHDPFK